MFWIKIYGLKASLPSPRDLCLLGKSNSPFLLELFCGSAGVCAQFRLLGGRALGVDHLLNHHKLKSAAVKLDLTEAWVQELVFKEIASGQVDAMHLGPPCGHPPDIVPHC